LAFNAGNTFPDLASAQEYAIDLATRFTHKPDAQIEIVRCDGSGVEQSHPVEKWLSLAEYAPTKIKPAAPTLATLQPLSNTRRSGTSA